MITILRLHYVKYVLGVL